RAQARTIAKSIDCTIGMAAAIGDQAAIVFAASFYRGLGFGHSVQDAFNQGIAALLLEGIPEERTHRLLNKTGTDPSTVFLLRNSHDDPHTRATRLVRLCESAAGAANKVSDRTHPEWRDLSVGLDIGYAKDMDISVAYVKASYQSDPRNVGDKTLT